VALKSYVLSPFSDAQYVDMLSSILDAREQLRREEEEKGEKRTSAVEGGGVA
jgi:hypothetical protein